MPLTSTLAAFWRNLVRRTRAERELDEELRAFVELRAAEKVRGGMDPDAARRAAQVELGGVEQVKESVREVRAGVLLETLARDLRYALRSLIRTPAFTAAAIVTLALGIGASTAVFSVVNAVLLRPLPYREPDRLAVLTHKKDNAVAAGNYVSWSAQSRSFAAMGAAEWWAPNLTDTEQPEKVWALTMTPSMFPLLGVAPLYGRVFSPDAGTSGRDHEVVVSYGFWQRRLAASPTAVGRTLTLDGEKYTIVGIMPASFRFAPFWATRTEVWAPLALEKRATDLQGQSLRVFARLKDGVTLSAARADIAAVTARLEQAHPGTNLDVRLTPLDEMVVGDIRHTLVILFGAVGFVLLIACANVAHMMLTRASTRYREMAVRSALGAGRARLLRQLLTESTVLALLGGAGGVAIAAVGVRVLVAQSGGSIPRAETIALDARVLLFALVLSLATSVLFGLVPAMQSGLRDLNDALREGSRGSSAGIHRTQLRSALVASEFALALMLLVGAGLMIRSFRALGRVDAGFDPRGVATMIVSVAGSKEEAPERRTAFYESIRERIAALPGVQSVSAINHLPIAGDMWGMPYAIEGRASPKPGEVPHATYRVAMTGYFRTMRLPLLRGRDFESQDRKGAPGVVIVNEELARLEWPGEDPLGKRLAVGDLSKDIEWLTVVGVAKNAVRMDWTAKAEAELYLPFLQNRLLTENRSSWVAYVTFVARTTGDAAALTAAMRRAVASLDANVPVSEVQTMEDVVARATAEPRFNLLLLASFAGVALVLAALGIYSVISYGVTRRTHEIGIRMALGADRHEVTRMVVAQGLTVAIAGGAAGLAGALALTRWATALLYGVSATDPLTFSVVSGSLLLVALVASYLPARRASRIDPILALRSE